MSYLTLPGNRGDSRKFQARLHVSATNCDSAKLAIECLNSCFNLSGKLFCTLLEGLVSAMTCRFDSCPGQ